MNSSDSKAREAFEAHLKSQPDWAPEFEVHRAWVEKFAEFAWHAALQWAASQQATEGNTVCPRCNGSGDQEYLVGGGPDAHDEVGPCSGCGGSGAVAAAPAQQAAERHTPR